MAKIKKKILLVTKDDEVDITDEELLFLSDGEEITEDSWDITTVANNLSEPLPQPKASIDRIYWVLSDSGNLKIATDETKRLLSDNGKCILRFVSSEKHKLEIQAELEAGALLHKMTEFDKTCLVFVEKKILPGSSSNKSLKKEVSGHLDSYSDLYLRGWVWNKNNPAERLEVELLADDKVISIFKCDKPRPDLVQAGVGDGNYGFAYPVPIELCDGTDHQLALRERTTGTLLINTPFLYEAPPEYRGEVKGLEGTSIIGWVTKTSESYHHPLVSIYEGDVLVGEVQAGDSEAVYDFRFSLPANYLDGRPHAFTIKADGKFYLGNVVEVTPCLLTPFDALQQYANGKPGSVLSPIAGFRYQALMRQISALTQGLGNGKGANDNLAERIRTLNYAHDEITKGYQRSRDTYAPISLPQVKAPLVSIVIPVHNKFNLTYNCLLSLLLADNKASFEVIVVDDGSKDETVDIASIVTGIQHIRHETAQGFILSCNDGGKLARGQYIVMLNNDTEVTSGWIDEMLYVFDRYEKVGLVGSMLLYEDGSLQEAGGIVWETANPWNYGRNQNPRDPKFNYTRQVDYLSGASIMLPKSLWDELEGFDIEFVPAYFEDTDIAFRVRDKGYKTVFAPFSKVVHFEGKSSGTDTKSGTKRFQEINRPKFKQRWVKACRYNGEEGKNVELAKDRNVEYRALVVDAETPRPDMDAGSYAAIQEMRLLQSLGFKLTFVPENMAYLGQYTEDLQRMGIESVFAPFYNSVQDILAKRGHEFDVIYITRYYVAEKLLESIREHAPRAKIVFNNADLHFLRELRGALLDKNQEQLQQAIQTRDKELSVMRQVDVVLSYNETEHAVILSHNLDSTKIALCPWVVETKDIVPSYESRKGIAFLGGYGHWPNVEAVKTFVREVMPALRKKLPGVPFLIYGSRPENLKDLEEADDVILMGWVKDVSEVYDTCRVFIAPLKSGAGLKGKVVGAMSYGVPCVISPVAAEGISLNNGHDVMIAETVDEWVKAIADVYGNPTKWKAISESSRLFTKSKFSFEHGRELMKQALEQVDIFTDIENAALVEMPAKKIQ